MWLRVGRGLVFESGFEGDFGVSGEETGDRAAGFGVFGGFVEGFDLETGDAGLGDEGNPGDGGLIHAGEGNAGGGLDGLGVEAGGGESGVGPW